MGKGVLGCLKKRDLIQDEGADRESLGRYGREYLSQGRPLEALEFFEQARDEDGLRSMKDLGREEGDPFLYKQACRLLKENPDPADWKIIADKALAGGRVHQALAAFRALNDEGKIQELERLIDELKRHDEPQP